MVSPTAQGHTAFWIVLKMCLATLNEAEESFAMTATGSCLDEESTSACLAVLPQHFVLANQNLKQMRVNQNKSCWLGRFIPVKKRSPHDDFSCIFWERVKLQGICLEWRCLLNHFPQLQK